uniref:Fucolectin tachylectin-4 pentraxin-1 domain-containing protein n=1 Tax=Magallana gigas TaxID=29159 RepID=A0A8W8NPG1_MAGGI
MSLYFGVGLLAFASAYVNIALNKPANLQHPLIPDDNTHNASNAVDGRKSNLTWNGGQCSASAARETATWWVNLTDIRSIHHITIYYMVGQRPWGSSNLFTPSFLGLSVYVSNTADKLQGTLCFKDNIFTVDTIPANLTITCPIHGQYVIYYNERLPGVTYPKGYSSFAQSDLCEVEVYGCHTTGYNGLNCSIPCPNVNCQYCHIETGTCQGCKPGYQGQRCDTVCPYGFF